LGQTAETQTSNGWSVKITAAHLPKLKSGQVYESVVNAGEANQLGRVVLTGTIGDDD
jgi:hypothetical protein